MYKKIWPILFVIFVLSTHVVAQPLCQESTTTATHYFVSTDGNDYQGNGSRVKPWRNIEFAIYKAKENSTIIVKPGIYTGSIRIKKAFTKNLLIKSEIPYLAKLTNNARVLAIVGQAANITIEGFEITHLNESAKPLVVHIDAYGDNKLHNITLRNNIIHDSFNNDLLKINNGAHHITIECNLFYNQGDSDEHIDINSAQDITISDNIFLNDFPASNRTISKHSSSYIVVKDSNANEDQFLGAKNIQIMRNIFANWQGSIGHGYILIGEDGKPYFEAENVFIYNNLLLGNSSYSMRSPLGVKGAKNIYFYQNTISGDLPSNAFAIRVNTEGDNPTNDNIFLYHNIYSDPFGTMGQGIAENTNDFSDTLMYQLNNFKLDRNVYWNGGMLLPHSIFDKINISDDRHAQVINPKFSLTTQFKTPLWNAKKLKFLDNSFTIREAFKRIIYLYAVPHNNLNSQSVIQKLPLSKYNILGELRNKKSMNGAINTIANTKQDKK